MPNETFISYARLDKSKVIPIFDGLKNLGIDPWLDAEDIRPVTQWKQEILLGIQCCYNFVYCLSENSVSSQYCEMELLHALLHDKRIIPIQVDSVKVADVHPAIRELNWIILSDGTEQALEKLREVIETPDGVSFGQLNSRLEIVSSDGDTRRLNLNRSKYLIGRNPVGSIDEFGIILIEDRIASNSSISRTQLTLEQDNGRWHVMDGAFNQGGYKPSKNGTRVNGKKLGLKTKRPLRNLDKIKISPNITIIYEEIYPGDLIVSPDNRDTFV